MRLDFFYIFILYCSIIIFYRLGTDTSGYSTLLPQKSHLLFRKYYKTKETNTINVSYLNHSFLLETAVTANVG